MTVVITAQMALEARDQLLWIATHTITGGRHD